MHTRFVALAAVLALAGCSGNSSSSSSSGSSIASSSSTSSSSSSSGSTGQGSTSSSSSASSSTGSSSGSSGTSQIGSADVTFGDGSSYGSGQSAVIYRADGGSFDPSDLEVVIDSPTACLLAPDTENGLNLGGDENFIRVHISFGDGGAVGPGTYALDGVSSLVALTEFSNNGGNGGGGTELYSSGTLTLSTVSASEIDGSFSGAVADGGAVLISSEREIAGTFTAGACP